MTHILQQAMLRHALVKLIRGEKMCHKRSMITDKITFSHTYTELPNVFYTKQLPENVPFPQIKILNRKLAEELGIDVSFLESREGIQFLSGSKIIKNSSPIAQAYAGHQFGYFTMLGDGRAVLLGEYQAKDGQRYDIQLKGSGRTPYSRGGDGKAALGPMLREYIISEGMYGLGIPTTRSLAVTVTGETIRREESLDGAVLARIAKSHIRVGTFEYASGFLNTENVKKLADYTIKWHFPMLEEEMGEECNNIYHGLLHQIVKRQAYLIAKWQLVGFIHGVMNTDNMAVTGETIDYGPCAFMDRYKPDTVFSSIDINGRYAYQNQPSIAMWNLAILSETVLPLLDSIPSKAAAIADKEVTGFAKWYKKYWLEGMGKKLGIESAKEEDVEWMEQLLSLMEKYRADYTDTFFQLTRGTIKNTKIYQMQDFKEWFALWEKRVMSQNQTKEEVNKRMKQNNPIMIPRNYLVEEALEAAVERRDDTVLKNLVEALQNPYDYENIPMQYTKVPRERDSCMYKTYCGT